MPGRRKTAVLLLAAFAAMLTMSLLAGGCGSDDNSSSTDENLVNTDILDAAEKNAANAAVESAKKAKDRYLPGRIEARVVCSQPTPPPQPETPYQLKCHVEGFGNPANADHLSYMTFEDWFVPVDSQGKAGEPTLAGQARIRKSRRKDDRLNCTNRKARPEKCAPPL